MTPVTEYIEQNSSSCGFREDSSDSISTIVVCGELECYQR